VPVLVPAALLVQVASAPSGFVTLVAFEKVPDETTEFIFSVLEPLNVVVVSAPDFSPYTAIGSLVVLYVPQISACPALTASWLSPPKMNWSPTAVAEVTGLSQDPGIGGSMGGEDEVGRIGGLLDGSVELRDFRHRHLAPEPGSALRVNERTTSDGG
jgi:hypothetical protein